MCGLKTKSVSDEIHIKFHRPLTVFFISKSLTSTSWMRNSTVKISYLESTERSPDLALVCKVRPSPVSKPNINGLNKMLLPPTRLIIQAIIQNAGQISISKSFLSAVKPLNQEHVACRESMVHQLRGLTGYWVVQIVQLKLAMHSRGQGNS